jgi:hypothetical protein
MKTIEEAKRESELIIGQKYIETTGGVAQNDITVRDYFAAAALTGMCANHVMEGEWQSYALGAYAAADAMLKERAK